MAPKKREGQILILMALLSTTLIILFGMVVSIGHLVQAKINLQNSVDLAAMSGASWQARFLNEMSLINYRMRQNYKFALYDLYVTQSRFNKGFRDTVARPYSPGMDPFDRVYNDRMVFGICQQMEGYMPQRAIGEEGEGTAGGTDMCQNVDDTRNYIPPIVPSPVVGTNPILIAANQAIRALSERAKQVCRDASGQNTKYFEYAMQRLDRVQAFQMLQLKTVLDAFGDAFRSGDSVDSSGGMATNAINSTFRKNLISANSAATIAYINPPKTLAVSASFKADFAEMFTTRSPPSGEFTEYFEVLESFFRIRVVNIGVDSAGGCQFTVGNEVSPDPRKFSGGLGTFLGLARARTSQTPGAPVKIPFSVVLRAEVKPRLLFWPRGLTPTLIAVAAAKPFGSRIGPSKPQTTKEVTGMTNARTSSGEIKYPLANMSFYPGDMDTGDGFIPGVGHKKILGFLYSALKNPTRGVNFDRPSITNTNNQCLGGDPSFLCLALAPTLYEGLFWNVFPYPPQTNSSKYISTAVVNSLFPRDVEIQTASDNYIMLDRMPYSFGGQYNDLWHYTDDMLGNVQQFKTQSGDPLFFANRPITLSSWSPTDYDLVAGRLGYQIKLASVQEICQDMQDGGGVVSPTGALQGYCTGGSSYNRVAH